MCREVLRVTFARGRITALRRAVSEHAAREGLSGGVLEDFVLAVNEITTNAVLHGGGHGTLRLLRDVDVVWCEVVDEGPGLPPGWMGAARLPTGHQQGGRGLWLTSLLCDNVTVMSGPTGTTVTFSVPAGRVCLTSSPDEPSDELTGEP
jgi:anti-sigma regulatory factor (Ser/Thr protein kinase)